MTDQEAIPVAAYLRVSSDDQRDRETIKTQREAIDRFLAQNPQYRLYRYYDDDGLSGTIPMALRPAGGQLIADAKAGKFLKIIVLRASRLGREEVDLLTTYNLFVDLLGIELIGVAESLGDRTIFGFQSIMAGYARRQFLADSARGMDRAAREGRYTGGIVPLGYRVEGRRQTARLMPDETLIWGDWSAAHLVRRIYHWLGVEGKSCRWIANELNLLCVPTVYERAGRGIRDQRTQGIWRPGRIRNLVVNPVFRGVLQFGRRSSRVGGREVISAPVEPLVSDDVWYAAQETLARNRIIPKNSKRTYLLRSVIRCGICGLNYCGSTSNGAAWYRCNGQLVERGPIEGRCNGKSVRGDTIEPLIWSDIERFLRSPGELLDELAIESCGGGQAAVAEAESITLTAAIRDLDQQRKRALDLRIRGHLTPEELETCLGEIASKRTEIERRLVALGPKEDPEEALEVTPDLLAEITRRLDEGLRDEERQEIVRLLVRRITVQTELRDGRKHASAVVEYRFPSVVSTCRGTREGQNYTVARRVLQL